MNIYEYLQHIVSTTPWILQGWSPFPLQYPHNCVDVTMINPATGWFKMVKLPVIEIFKTDGDDVKMAETFDKTSSQIAKLVNQS